MMLSIVFAVVALGAGAVLPTRWGVRGFLAVAAGLFLAQFAVNAATGFAGSSLEESLLLFNGSVAAYLGFNLQVTYRAFALPLLALAVPFILRLSRRSLGSD